MRLRHHGETIWLRLTHIARKGTPRGDPVLLLHGFGSGGIQFTHESIPVPMAAYLATAGLDVWVGELRTSIGLPTCERQWVMDDIAKNDVPALVDHVRGATDASRSTWSRTASARRCSAWRRWRASSKGTSGAPC